MNQRRYRLIFNKVRGQLMAVAETAARQGKASGETRGPTAGGGATLVATVRPLAFALWGLLGLVSLAAEAQIVAYKAAPPSQRPTVLTAGNGVPLVNIQTPSAAGVSRNTYEQFDVATQGAILNNSRTNVQTQLGGWVQGNPWLATGSARVILNEVIAANPSQLLGHIEVAGASAQIVIANPAGITCSGCGFLNANRVTLTTGTPQINNGDLTGYRVTGGAIRIEGAGLDASQAGYTDLIARAVDINAGLWAQTLAVTTGANQVTADNTAATPIAGNGAAPAFALDVAHLGGMYAGKITLVGTEAGVGVRNAGQIGASVGNVVVTVDGQLINAGALQAGGNLHIGATSGLDNSGGALAAGQNLNLTAASLGNDNGEIGAGQQIAIDAAGSLSNRAGQIVAGTNLGIGAGSGVDNSGGLLSAGQALRLETGRLDNTGGTLGTVAGPLTARIGGPLANDGGQIAAGGDLGLSADSLAGLGDLFAQGNLNLQLASAYTHTGQLIAGGNLLLQTAGPLANQSIIQANGQLDIHAPAVDNTATGQILASDLALTTGALTNRGLIDGNRVRIAADVLDNLGSGRLYGGTLAIAADILNNRPEGDAAPLIAARDQLDLGVGSLDNGEASLIFSAGDMAVGGALDAADRAIGQADAIRNTSASIEALGDLAINAASLVNQRAAFSMERVLSTELPTGRELLLYNPALYFFWNIEETNPVNWRNFVRDRLIASINDLLGGTLDAAYRAELVAVVNAMILGDSGNSALWQGQSYRDTQDVWARLLDKIEADRPGDIDTMAATLASRLGAFPLKAYNQQCFDSECDYVNYTVRQRTDRQDIVTSDAPAASVRAGGNASLAIGDLVNRYSSIQAGGDMTLTGNTLSNEGAELYRVTDTITQVHRIHWTDRDHGTTTSAATTSTLIGSAPAVISAGGNLAGSYTGLIDNQTIRENTAPLAPSGEAPAVLTLAPIGQAAQGTGATLPLAGSSLLSTHPDPNARYLIETDPRFANYRDWLSSDYMLNALSYDPALTQKRLGDGFYEQRLITEQVAQLTGRRFLAGYADDEAQYRALMDAGLTFAQDHSLIPGVALSAEQIAQLTSDIVWLVAQEVTLADGSTQQVLVPQVYVRVRDGDLSPNGALIAADTIRLETAGDLVTGGTIAGRQIVSLAADNLTNLRGRIAGQDVEVLANNDLTLRGGAIEAQNSLIAAAGRDLTIESATSAQHSQLQGTATFADTTVIDRVAGLYVTGDNAILLAAAGRDFNLNAAAVYNGGDGGVTVLQAGRDLTLGTVTETLDSYAHTQTSWRKENATTQVGSLVQAQGDILLLAGNDLTARGATVASQEGALAALAGGDIALATATNTHNVSQPGIGTGVPIATYVMNPLEVLRHQRFSGTAKPPGRAAVSPRLA